MRPFAMIALLLAPFAAGLPVPAGAQNRAGEFDHYVLALSWIPAYCALDGDDRADARCGEGAGVGWAVHGLWPQHADGTWPEYCPTVERAPSRRETAAQADLFGSSGSAWHQWNKHGRCSGLSARDYYRLVAEAARRLTFPEVFGAIDRELRIDPDVIEAAFIEANPDLAPDMMVTTCPGGDLVELRVCLTRDLAPRPCAPRTLGRECRRDTATLLPLR